MASKQMALITKRVRDQWPRVLRIAIQHRIGKCDLMQESVCIAVSCPHRKEAFDIVEFIIDEIKRTVPIWKQEVFEDGSKHWKSSCCNH